MSSAHAADPPRGYEQVTPASKEYGFGSFGTEFAIASRSGDGVAYPTYGALPGSASANLENFNIGRRAKNGWQTTPVAPLQNPVSGGGQYPLTFGFSTDLSRSVLQTLAPQLTSDAAADVANLYLRDNDAGTYRLITNTGGSAANSPFSLLGGASDDFSHIVFQARDPLTPGAPVTGSQGVYEWVDGTLRNVGILPDGTPVSAALLGADVESLNRVTHAVSSDGRRIVFTSFGFPREIYVRQDGTSTVQASTSRRSTLDPVGSLDKLFWGASIDGSKVFFTSNQALTDDATTGDDGSGNPTGASANLYEYDVAANTLTDLTVATDPADAATGSGVQGVVGTSDDGEYVYFVASAQLAPGATAGAMNLFVRHAGATKYIGALDFSDAANWGIVERGASGITSRVSRDGTKVLFQSIAPLTGYDNTDAAIGSPDPQVFLYDAGAGQLKCLSCRADGSKPRGASTISPPDLVVNIPRNISDDGQRVFFDSADDLLRNDTNGRRDVYEWSEKLGLELVSDGSSRFDASFQDASASGADVFLSTRAPLTPQDTDGHVDLYDARIGGGFSSPPPPPPPCVADACQGPRSDSAPPLTAASVTFFGPGNATTPGGSRPAPKIRLGKASAARGTSTVVKVTVPAAGTVRVTGAGLKTATKRVARASTAKVSVRLGSSATSRLKKRGTVAITARVSYTASDGRRTTATLKLTFRKSQTHKKERS